MTEGFDTSLQNGDAVMRPAADRRTGALERALEPMRRVARLPLSNLVSVQTEMTQTTSGAGFVPAAAQTESDRAALHCALSRTQLRGVIREAQPGVFIAPPAAT